MVSRKFSNRSGSIPRPGRDSAITPGYRAPGSNGPAPINPRDADVGPQTGPTRVVTSPGDPSFPHDILVRQGLYHATNVKQAQVPVHSAFDHHRQKHMRGAPANASDVLDQASTDASGLNSGAKAVGLDSAS
jgi:hypothetical protein